MDYDKEIPFGAFDSELMHQEISIPEGFEATIEGDKIILTRTESEDEKARKGIIDYVTLYKDSLVEEEYKSWIAWLEKQGEPSIKWNKNAEGNKPQINHSVLMKTTYGIAEGEWDGECWLQYRWSSRMKDNNILSWIELSDLRK